MIEPHHHHLRAVALISTGLAIGVFTYLVTTTDFFHPKAKAPVVSATHQLVQTPRQFPDFVGTVSGTAAESLQVDFMNVANDGTVDTIVYQVGVLPTTDLRRQTDGVSGPTLTPIALAAITTGDKVHVFSDHNVAAEPQFSALQIYQLTWH